MQRPASTSPHATGHAVIAGALCLSLLVMLPLVAIPAGRGLAGLVLALIGT